MCTEDACLAIVLKNETIVLSGIAHGTSHMHDIARVNLNDYFQKIFGAEKGLFWFLVHVLVHKEALKQWVIQCLIVLSNRYQLLFGAHWHTKFLWSKIFGIEQHRPGCIPCKTYAKGTPSPKLSYARYFQGERNC